MKKKLYEKSTTWAVEIVAEQFIATSSRINTDGDDDFGTSYTILND